MQWRLLFHYVILEHFSKKYFFQWSKTYYLNNSRAKDLWLKRKYLSERGKGNTFFQTSVPKQVGLNKFEMITSQFWNLIFLFVKTLFANL